MYVEHIADAVTSTAAVIQAIFPQDFPAENIQAVTDSSFLKDSRAECDNAFENQGVIASLLVGQLSHWEGSGCIGCTGQILTAAVVEQEVASVDHRRTLRFRSIMHHCSVVTVSNYSCKAVSFEVFPLLTEGVKLFRSLILGDGFPFLQGLVQPAVKFRFCNTILQICLISILCLDLIFDRLHQLDRVVC